MKSKTKFKPTKKHVIQVIILVLLLVFFYWQNNGIVITNYDYISKKVTQELEGYKIVQISDLHNKRFGAGHKKLLQVIKEQNPDIIVVTGDLIDSNYTNIETAVEFMKLATEIAPTYYITGNHEEWVEKADKENLLKQIEQNGTKILDDDSVMLGTKEGKFRLMGLAENSLDNNKLTEMTSELDMEKELVVLLAHEPQYINRYSRTNVDLVLSGHAHGGQFRIPFVGGIVAPGQGFLPEYTEGMHTEGKTTMIISRGLGNSIIPIRLFNRPEVVCVQLKSQ